MKKKRVLGFLLSLAIATTFLTSGKNTLSVKAWTQEAHEKSVADLASNPLFTKMIDIGLVKTVAAHTDDWYGLKKQKFQVNALHGLDNYVANLKFLYGVVHKYLYPDASKSDPVTATLKEQWPTNQVDSDVVKAVKKEIEAASTNKAKASRVLGLAAHLSGDIFAHRLIVPKSTISGENGKNNPKERSGNLLGKSDFGDNWDTVVGMINSGKLQCWKIKRYMKPSIESPGKTYEDNTSYYPSRYSVATKWALTNLFDELCQKVNTSMSIKVLIPNVSGYTGELHDFAGNYADAYKKF